MLGMLRCSALRSMYIANQLKVVRNGAGTVLYYTCAMSHCLVEPTVQLVSSIRRLIAQVD